MPLVNVQLMEGRSQDKIDKMIHEVTESVSRSLESPKENVRVVVNEVPKSHWGIGGVSAEKLGK